MLGVKRTLGRIKTGFALTRDGIEVLRNHPKLAALPAISGVATIAFLVVFLAPMLLFDSGAGFEPPGQTVTLAILFVWYFGTAFIAAFFNAALVHATGDVFAGKEPSLERSLRAAAGELKLLLAWAFASAVVGVLLRVLESQDNVVADLIRLVVAVGWTITTFFVLPVIVFEDVTFRELFGRSRETFQETWGETLGVGIGISLTVTLATLLLLAVTAVPSFALGFGTVGVLFGLAVLVLGYLAYATIWGVVKTALYGYATEGTVPSEFEDVDFARFEDQSA